MTPRRRPLSPHVWMVVASMWLACTPPSSTPRDRDSTDSPSEVVVDTGTETTAPIDPNDLAGDGDPAEAAGGRDCNDLDDQVRGDDCAGNWPSPTLTLTLDVDDPAIGLYLPDVQASYPEVDWSTLERLYIPAGHYKFITLGNLQDKLGQLLVRLRARTLHFLSSGVPRQSRWLGMCSCEFGARCFCALVLWVWSGVLCILFCLLYISNYVFCS